MASPGSFTRSAAQATSSAYRRLPIRWRLAGGSAVLTLVILLGFAAIVGVLTTRRINDDFTRNVASRRRRPQAPISSQGLQLVVEGGRVVDVKLSKRSPDLDTYARLEDAVIRVVYQDGTVIAQTEHAPYLPPPRADREDYGGYRIDSRSIAGVGTAAPVWVQYADRLADTEATANRVRVFLGLGVLGGAALALLAGLATATRAMAPIQRLTDAAREIERSRDPSLSDPAPRGQRRGLRARAHARGHAPRARRGARRDGGDARPPAPVRRRREPRAAHAAHLRAGQPRAARDGARGRAARGRRLRPALQPPHAPAGRRPPAARARRRRPRRAARRPSTSPRSSPRPPGSSSPSRATT